MSQPRVGIIGGSGLYHIEGFTQQKWVKVKTPFGPPSDSFLTGKLAGREVVFLPRHGRGHRILPSELNHRANIWGMKKLGVAWVISVSAVGSLQAKYRPCDIVLPDQFVDRTKQSSAHTFFGRGIVAHIAFAAPGLRGTAAAPAESRPRAEGARPRRRHLCQHGRPGLQHARGVVHQPQARLRRRRHDQPRRSQMLPRSGDRLRDDGDDHRLRLLEGRRGARHGGDGHREPDEERRHGQSDRRQGAAADSRRAELALPRRA